MPIFEVDAAYIESRRASLSEGTQAEGWHHIRNGKTGAFAGKGLNDSDAIQDAIKSAVKSPDFVFRSNSTTLEIYERRGDWLMKVIANAVHGNIVTAMPVSGADGDYSRQAAALERIIQHLKHTTAEYDFLGRVRLATLQHIAMDFAAIAK